MNNTELDQKYAQACAELGQTVSQLVTQALVQLAAINQLKAEHLANEAVRAQGSTHNENDYNQSANNKLILGLL